jgi:hypothetical protein
VFKKSFIIVNVALLFGCNAMLFGTFGEKNQNLEDFAESVFILQNKMTNAVMFSETELSPTILEAEKKMHIACEPLNKAGNLQFDGLSVDFELAQRIQQTAEGCEKAAQQLQILLLTATR